MSDSKYLLKIKPLEPYFFGDENSIRFDNSNSYYVTSLPTPSATTIMGMLRYTLLEQQGILKTDGYYSEAEQEKMVQLIGAKSFAPGDSGEYGVIQEVSPVFLLRDSDMTKFIKMPLNHDVTAGKEVYKPLRLFRERKTSFGTLQFPANGKVTAKEYDRFGVSEKYMSIEDGRLFDEEKEKEELFRDFYKVTTRKNARTDGFMKKKFKILHPGFSFGVVVTLAEGTGIQNTICTMGREKSSFSLTAIKIEDPEYSLEKEITAKYLGTFSGFCYVLGDVVLEQAPQYKAYAMIKPGSLRSLHTSMSDTRISRGKKRYSLIGAGSVLYDGHEIQWPENNRFGLNKIITLGGK